MELELELGSGSALELELELELAPESHRGLLEKCSWHASQRGH